MKTFSPLTQAEKIVFAQGQVDIVDLLLSPQRLKTWAEALKQQGSA